MFLHLLSKKAFCLAERNFSFGRENVFFLSKTGYRYPYVGGKRA